LPISSRWETRKPEVTPSGFSNSVPKAIKNEHGGQSGGRPIRFALCASRVAASCRRPAGPCPPCRGDITICPSPSPAARPGRVRSRRVGFGSALRRAGRVEPHPSVKMSAASFINATTGASSMVRVKAPDSRGNRCRAQSAGTRRTTRSGVSGPGISSAT
jgi:hypothetical protein